MQGGDSFILSLLPDTNIVVNGGIHTPENAAAIVMLGARAIGISSMFQYTQYTPKDAKNTIAKYGYEVRQ